MLLGKLEPLTTQNKNKENEWLPCYQGSFFTYLRGLNTLTQDKVEDKMDEL